MAMDDDQTNYLLNWTYLYQQKSMDEATQSLVLTMELQEARLKAEDDLKSRDQQILHLKDLLSIAIEERDEARENCRKMLLEKQLVQQKLQRQSAPHSAISSIEDDPRRGFSDSDESIVSSPEAEPDFPVPIDRPLPEKGKFLQAVMKAGPLLQTLLLAGPLPQWRHPPPPVDAHLIPPPPVVVPPSSTHFLHQDSLHGNINNCGRITRKRSAMECSDEYQTVVLQ
ncbi:hypothetical protein ACS0TY_020749 [Phlomoides rotata]